MTRSYFHECHAYFALLVATAAMAGGCAGTDGTRSAEPEQTATNVAALLTGDFDGDGTADQLTVTSTGISIYHPTQRSTHSYYFTGNFAINNANTDLDGKAGLEVVVTTANGISVITDRTSSTNPYQFAGTYQINTLVDTDGQAGAEVVVSTASGITVIRQRTASTQFYQLTSNYQINSVVDTDGQPGADIIVVFSGSSSSGITIIHDRSNYAHAYSISPSFQITAVCNDDSQAGAEIFFSTSSQKFILNDRLGSTSSTTKTNCSCNTVYRDADNDGYGDPNTSGSSCTVGSGYVSNSQDCCDSDATTHPGVTTYYSVANKCNSFDYNCDGAASKKSNGPTDCYNFNVGCAVNSTHTACPFTSPLPADCNGGLVDYSTAECGQTWYIGARGCSIYGTPSGYACTGWTWGGPGGTQACR